MPLEGQVGSSPNHLDMPELLFAVCATGKTGRLVLHAGDVEKSVFLSEIIYNSHGAALAGASVPRLVKPPDVDGPKERVGHLLDRCVGLKLLALLGLRRLVGRAD